MNPQVFLLSSELFVQCIYYSTAIILIKLPKTQLQADAARVLGPTGYTLLSEHLNKTDCKSTNRNNIVNSLSVRKKKKKKKGNQREGLPLVPKKHHLSKGDLEREWM